MNCIKSTLTAFAIVASLTACSDDDDDDRIVLTDANVPTEITNYVKSNFPQNAILKTVKETNGKSFSYEVLLAENFQLEFDEAFNIVEIDGVTALPASVIPDAILDYVAEHYATYFITDWELELDHQQVELNNKVELEFRMDGTFIRIDND
jgi:Protein of unknown function (DUF2874).